MPRNGNGVYTSPAGTFNPAVDGQPATATDWNATRTDYESALTNSVASDGQTTLTANLPMSGFKHTGVASATARDQYAAAAQVQDGGLVYAADMGAADAYVITLTPAIPAYVIGQVFRILITSANLTTAPTLAVSGLLSGAIKMMDGSAPPIGALSAGSLVAVGVSSVAALVPTFQIQTATPAAISAIANAAAAAASLIAAPIGSSKLYVGRVAPTKWLLEDGASYAAATYPDLFAVSVRSGTVTITIASPAVVTWTANNLWDGDPVKFTSTGALATGLVVGTVYYLKRIDANTFNVAATPGGTNIVTTGTQSGVHTAICAPSGCANDLSTFNVPDSRGVSNVGHDVMGRTAAGRLTVAGSGMAGASLGYIGGEQTHVLTIAELAAHTHDALAVGNQTPSTGGGAVVGVQAGGLTGSTGSDTPHNNVQPSSVRVWIIRALA